MFDQSHYVPVLRWKRGEWAALRTLSRAARARITPMIELMPSAFTDTEPKLTWDVPTSIPRVVKQIAKSWGTRSLYLDCDRVLRALPNLPPAQLMTALWASGRRWGLSFIPVARLHHPLSFKNALRDLMALVGEICIRLEPVNLAAPNWPEHLSALLATLGARPQDAHLIFDYQATWPMDYQIIYRALDVTAWKSFTVIGGTFPRDLTAFAVGQHLYPRHEWTSWRTFILSQQRLPRLPTYGDYATQHAVYREPPDAANFSASIRYTTDDHWLIMRGEGVFSAGSPGFKQWPENALLLCDREEFCGRDFSDGDAYIWQAAFHRKTTGNAETWLRAGINHHLTFVTGQIGKLLGSSRV
jgi:hypothetical protein